MSNVAMPYEVKIKEIINGVIVAMAPARMSHQRANSKLWKILDNKFQGRPCEVFFDTYVRLSKKEKYAPDVCIVCDPDAINEEEDIIEGVPNMVAEVLSESTSKRDKGHKKDVYEKYGVAEYWIVDVVNKAVEVYILRNGKYYLDEIYLAKHDAIKLETMTQDELDEITYEIKLSMFDDVIVDVREIFEGMV